MNKIELSLRKGVFVLIKNRLYMVLGVGLIILCMGYSLFFVYGSEEISYKLDGVEVECLFALEQDIVMMNSLNVDGTEDVEYPTFDKVNVLENSAQIVEQANLDGVNNIKIEELEEEYYVSNRLASRDISEEVGSSLETEEQKYYRIFGENYQSKMGKCYYYSNNNQAMNDMVGFDTKVWSLDRSGNWYQKEVYIECHKNIEATMKCIFADLLELPESERTPIKDIGMYNFRDGCSNHTCGVAVDINWNENAEMTNSGRITCGSYWRPYSDIYSIAPDSKMVEIFKSYGFGWGGEWTSKKDYMHFSYFDR